MNDETLPSDNPTVAAGTAEHAPATSANAPCPGMIWIPGGEFLMGSDKFYPEEAPSHRVRVAGFWMDRHMVTNRDFERFVAATGHVTLAEKPADPDDYPGAKPQLPAPPSTMFNNP